MERGRAQRVGSQVSSYRAAAFSVLHAIFPFFPCWLCQAAGERSKTVILVKNLPAGTSATELEEIFGQHGGLGRVLLPEGGITAIVEFLEPTEAKQAFLSLAYSRVRALPGEWGSW